MDGHTVSPFDLSQTLPVGGGLLVPYSLSGSPVIKQLMQMVTMVPGQMGGFNQCASPNMTAVSARRQGTNLEIVEALQGPWSTKPQA